MTHSKSRCVEELGVVAVYAHFMGILSAKNPNVISILERHV